jgi:hypothetical protein
MNAVPKNNNQAAAINRPGEHTRSRMPIPALVFFLAGATVSAVWFYRHSATSVAPVAAEADTVALSDATKAVLQHLAVPVEIRFYSMLDVASVPDSVQAYAGRADQLLAQYEQAAGGKVRVIRCNSLADSGANAAETDGISAFNLDKGAACFLGIAVVCGSQKEALSHLAPEWEQALEPDLTRAIARAAEGKPAAQRPTRIDATAAEAVRRAIPNLEAVSLEEGAKVLREAGMAQFQQAAVAMQAQVKEAEQHFLEAQASQSEAAQQAAKEQLRKIQAEGKNTLQQIALNAHAQIAALQQMKQTAP